MSKHPADCRKVCARARVADDDLEGLSSLDSCKVLLKLGRDPVAAAAGSEVDDGSWFAHTVTVRQSQAAGLPVDFRPWR